MNKKTHIGVYALITDQEKVLVIQKARGPYKGKYDLPGGSFDYGESATETLIREVKEETGLTVQNHELTDVFTCVVEYQDANGEASSMHHIGIVYSVTVAGGKLLQEGDGEDSHGAEWHSIAGINEDKYSPFVNRSKGYLFGVQA